MIIRRQIPSFVDAGYEVTAIDQGGDHPSAAEKPYRWVLARRFDWDLPTRWIWRVARRILAPNLHEHFWTAGLWLRLFSNALSIAAAALREKPDGYVAEDLQSAWGALFATRFRPRPIVYSAHEIESEQGNDPIRQKVLRALQRQVIPRVDRLVVPNAARAEVFKRDYRPKREPVVVLNCPPRTEVKKGGRLRDRLGLSPSTRIVLYHGALIPLRALDKLARGAAGFPSDVVLVLIGEQGEYYREVLAPIVESDALRGKVYCLPYVDPDQMAPYVASADLGIVIYENVNLNNYLCAPTKLYEFLSMRVPVAACNFPEVQRVLDEYKVGVSFDPADEESISRAVQQFFAMSGDELAVVRRDLDRAAAEFTWENEEQKWYDLLASLPLSAS